MFTPEQSQKVSSVVCELILSVIYSYATDQYVVSSTSRIGTVREKVLNDTEAYYYILGLEHGYTLETEDKVQYA